MNPWLPITDALQLKHLGKLSEELGECSAAVSRCIIQGVDECEPITQKSNRLWLTEELADVMANAILVIEHFSLDPSFLDQRVQDKLSKLRLWHGMLTPGNLQQAANAPATSESDKKSDTV